MPEDKGPKSDIIICRCNDVTLKEVEDAIDLGITDLEILRKYLRIGMGNCQGRTCLSLVQSVLSKKTKKHIEKIELSRSRAPLIPVPMRFFDGERK
jgi:bacterioferritin-associated ferredoxin